MPAAFELAQLNIAELAAPIDSPQLAGFVASLDRINALADADPGFLWRLQDESGNATSIGGFGDEYIVNLSVWRDIDSLRSYVYRSEHARVMARRRDWFRHMRGVYLALWWVPAGHRPDVREARERLDHLRANGPGPVAFTFKRSWPAPDTESVPGPGTLVREPPL